MPWYSAGTVTVTNGSITVTGSGTQFSANVRVGDAFRGPDGGWYEVTNVASATVLSINPPYESANAAGAPYRIAPIQGYVKESADRLRMIVEQWGQELSDLGSIGAWATAPDADAALAELGASEFGAQLIAAVGADAALLLLNASASGVAVLRAVDAAAQRAVLELGTAATRDLVSSATDVAAGKAVSTGWMGLGATSLGSNIMVSPADLDSVAATGVYVLGDTIIGVLDVQSKIIHLEGGSSATQTGVRRASNVFYERTRPGSVGTAWLGWVSRWTSGNTTVDSNGFIKNASPITKLYSDHVENNEEAKDVALQKESTGVYHLITERRLATEGWYIETPKDANGNIKVFIRYENTAEGILIETFEPDYSTGPVAAGAPVDIPDGRWIDIRMTYTQAEIDAQNVIESTENNPHEADPNE